MSDTIDTRDIEQNGINNDNGFGVQNSFSKSNEFKSLSEDNNGSQSDSHLISHYCNANAHQLSCLPSIRSSLISHRKQSFASDVENCDHMDAIPNEMSFTLLDAIAILFSIGSFLFDIGTDIAVAVFHYLNNDFWYFGLTAAFVLFPTLVMTGISMRWYVLDSREEGSPPISKCQWLMRLVFLCLQLGPILRYFDSLMYGLKFRQHCKDKDVQKKYFQYMVYEDTDATMLRLFECFMEAAPQLVLQIYILAKMDSNESLNDPSNPYIDNDNWTVVAQVVAVLASLVSLSWSLVSYHRALRMSLPDKINMSWEGIAIQFIWRFFVIASRVLALALFASAFRFYIGFVCIIHWLIMFVWIITMRTSFCDNRCEERGYNAVLAVMFIFCYFNPVDSPTRKRYAVYYTFMFFENTLLMFLWFNSCPKTMWYLWPAMIGHFASFFVGLGFMVLYYLKLHPSGDIKVWRNEEMDEGVRNETHGRRGCYKRQIQNGLWTTQGRLLHPRPAVPSLFSAVKSKQINNSLNKRKLYDKTEIRKENIEFKEELANV